MPNASRQLKMARVLSGTGFVEEARPALLEATHTIARALAVEHRLPQPDTFDDALQAPLSHLWGDALGAVRTFATDASADWEPAAEALGRCAV
jgi:hypothetical protein